MNKGEQAIKALREAADALEALPEPLRLHSMLGDVNNPTLLRNEARTIELRLAAFAEATEAAKKSWAFDDIGFEDLQTTDAHEWALKFMSVVDAGIPVSEGLMIAWFANCIEITRILDDKDKVDGAQFKL